ncbi:proline-rich receptor-like protein kinase PERK8 [Megalobrama amblycephala]|uniref:proline-rich receptor-like protein kinase PERK8 n=1 Tax=Megalobrama amblycephala TaxID=75352 RepID=UPI002014461C|nr:proline-rich receptor-like protein kinase PERK8 [Megalobrama amblycephala]
MDCVLYWQSGGLHQPYSRPRAQPSPCCTDMTPEPTADRGLQSTTITTLAVRTEPRIVLEPKADGSSDHVPPSSNYPVVLLVPPSSKSPVSPEFPPSLLLPPPLPESASSSRGWLASPPAIDPITPPWSVDLTAPPWLLPPSAPSLSIFSLVMTAKSPRWLLPPLTPPWAIILAVLWVPAWLLLLLAPPFLHSLWAVQPAPTWLLPSPAPHPPPE